MPTPQRPFAVRRGRTVTRSGIAAFVHASSLAHVTLAKLSAAAVLVFSLVFSGQTLHAVELKIEAPSFTFDSDRRIYRYQEARIVLGDTSLEAQEVLINERAGSLVAQGALRMRVGTLFISADRLDLDIETQSGTVTNARLYDSQTGYYLKAASMNVLPGRVFAASCTLTSCPPLVPGWKLSVRDLDYRVDDFAIGQNTLLEFGDVPVFWLPIMAWPTVSKRRSGILAPDVSTRTASLQRFNLGTRIGVPYFLDLGPSQDLTLTPEYIETRGEALTADYRYAFHGDQQGRLRVWGISEQYSRVPDQENNILSPGEAQQRSSDLTRYTFDFGHNEGIGDSGRILMNAIGSSDGQVRREYEYIENYRPEAIYQATYSNQASWGDTALTAEHASEYTVESVYANRSEFTNGPNRPLLAPRLSYGNGWKPFESAPFGIEFTGSLTSFQTQDDVSGSAFQARPALSIPLHLGEGIEFRSQFARQFIDYDGLFGRDQNTGLPVSASQGFSQSESQVELRSNLASVYRLDSGTYDAIKHRVTPRLIYDEVEDVHQPLTDRLFRGRIAEKLLTLRLDNSFIGELRNKPQAPVTGYLPTNQATQGGFDFIRQNQSTFAAVPIPPRYQRPPTEEFAQVNLIQRYNFLLEKDAPSIIGPSLPAVQETTPGNPLLPAIFQATYGRGGLTMNFETHYHHQLQRVTETSIGMNANLRRYTRIGIGYTENEFSYRTPENKLHPFGNSLSANGEVEVTDTLSTGFSGIVDLRDLPAPLGRRVQSSELFIDYHPICYRIRLSVKDSLEVTQTNGVDQYFTTERIVLTFDLGGLISSSREQTYVTGAPR